MTALVRVLRPAPVAQLRDLRTALAMFRLRGWAFVLIGALATLLVVGIQASLIENPLFARQLAPRPQDYAIWAATAALGGLIAGTFAVAPVMSHEGKVASGGVLSAIAVGCPICNKVAVALLGTSSALNIFGPSQVFIGAGSLVLLAWTLLLRARAVVGGCPVEGAGLPGPALRPPST